MIPLGILMWAQHALSWNLPLFDTLAQTWWMDELFSKHHIDLHYIVRPVGETRMVTTRLVMLLLALFTGHWVPKDERLYFLAFPTAILLFFCAILKRSLRQSPIMERGLLELTFSVLIFSLTQEEIWESPYLMTYAICYAAFFAALFLLSQEPPSTFQWTGAALLCVFSSFTFVNGLLS